MKRLLLASLFLGSHILASELMAGTCDLKPFSKLDVKITKVVDGDTIKIAPLKSQYKKCFKRINGKKPVLKSSVRMLFMDTPESTFMINGKKQSQGPMAIAAKEALEKLAPKGSIRTLQFYDIPKGIYGRLLATVHTKSGLNINREMIRLGLAYPFFYAPIIKDYKSYIEAHLKAIKEERGQFSQDPSAQTEVPHLFRSSLSGKAEAPYVGNLETGEILEGDQANQIPAYLQIFAMKEKDLSDLFEKLNQ